MNKELKDRIISAEAFLTDGNMPDNLLRESIRHTNKTGLFMEFGVNEGRTIRLIRGYMNEQSIDELLHGFDSFEGLPEDWLLDDGRVTHVKGQFACDEPEFANGRIRLVKGWFNRTLRVFLNQHKGPAAFVHVDCDLYSSTKCVLDELYNDNRIVSGTVIQFDEMYGYRAYSQHEGRAFSEFIESTGFTYEVLGKTDVAVSVRIKDETKRKETEK